MGHVEPLGDGDVMSAPLYMIFEFNPYDASMTRVGEVYSESPASRREAYGDAKALAEASARGGKQLQYLVTLVAPQGGFKVIRR